jgi:nitrite reductase/ring-hydroxylating ferredoxin subunit
LPESLRALAEQLRQAGPIVPPQEIYSDREVFVVELRKLFFRGWTLLDHAARLAAGSRYFLCDVATRAYIVVHENGEPLHAFRNRCLHAAYPICEEGDTQTGDMLVCKYHDWRYTLDGRLIHAPHLPATSDLSAVALKRYPVRRRHGLLFLAPSSDIDAPAEPEALALQPSWLESAQVSDRRKYVIPMNWKRLHWRVPSLVPLLLSRDTAQMQACGPLGWFAVADTSAVIVRLIPRSAQETALDVVWIGVKDDAVEDDAVLRELTIADSDSHAAGSAAGKFFDWYCSVMSEPEN